MRSKFLIVAATAAALAVPGSYALAQHRGGGGGPGGGGNAGISAGANVGGGRSFSPGANIGGGRGFSPGVSRSFNGGARIGPRVGFAPAVRGPGAFGGRRVFRGNRFVAVGPRFRHRRFFARRRFLFGGPFFASAYPYGSCWRWRWTPFGLRRIWVCGYRYW